MVRFKKHIISDGDTIQYIAQKHLGDMSLWVELASFNNLRHPYIVDTVEEKMKDPEHLLTLGDTILIRVSEDNQSNLISSLKRVNEYDQDEIYALALGKDLDIMPREDIYGNIIPDFENLEMKGTSRGDVATVRGIENLKQALYIRIATPKGSYVGHPEFGSEVHKFIGGKNTEETASLLDLEIERTLRTDRRVTNVVFNEHYINQNTYGVSFTVYTMSLQEAFEFIIAAQADGPIVLVDSFTDITIRG